MTEYKVYKAEANGLLIKRGKIQLKLNLQYASFNRNNTVDTTLSFDATLDLNIFPYHIYSY